MANLPRGNRNLLRCINDSIILITIEDQCPNPLADKAQISRANSALVTTITADLIDEAPVFKKDRSIIKFKNFIKIKLD